MIEFYDENEDARAHSNAVKTLAHEEFAIALFCQYMGTVGATAQRIPGSCLPLTGKTGKRLDAWVRVEDPSHGLLFYQTEVKAASFHGYRSGKAIPCDSEKLKKRMREEFERCWNKETGRFHDLGLDKVLHEMRRNELGAAGEKAVVRPLACLWAPMHEEWDVRSSTPFFKLDGVKDSEAFRSPFKSVWIFSASACLRQYLHRGIDELILDLPKLEQTQKYFDEIYGRPQERPGD
ncbi:Uncharacterised protein [Burkholderia pseudomallei]|uniref:hypothetical protein n=1 Tax=Burkholderia pseudomallei TaxID=28450 RepID=UPI000F19938B|nr:hypothetical protein [Burkholderia pseudomallei]CAJ7236903.1 Uncharacterised protein [Burkholderia pseudomallei]VBC15493.1 Uncharacterised protein [Burkholderia pseudomallei]VBS98798.1 Uncharacterised protein [Burkholderia pseudomallei]